MSKKLFEAEHCIVGKTSNGWTVEKFSRWSGAITGRKVLIKFCKEFPENMDINGKWNDDLENYNALYLAESQELCNPKNIKVLRKGYVVR